MTRTVLVASAIVSTVVSVGFFVMLHLVLTSAVPPENADLAKILLGGLGASFTMVVSFWVGSSLGSKSKDSPA